MHAATQQTQGTITTQREPRLQLCLNPVHPQGAPLSMSPKTPRQFTIQGLTLEGRTFRPSDWAERLAGALAARGEANGLLLGFGRGGHA